VAGASGRGPAEAQDVEVATLKQPLEDVEVATLKRLESLSLLPRLVTPGAERSS
jgi:hypothetical protein